MGGKIIMSSVMCKMNYFSVMNIMFLYIAIFSLIGCDSFYVLRGRVYEEEKSNNRIFNVMEQDTQIVLQKVLLSIYVLQEENKWENAWLDHSLYSDSTGNFSLFSVISPTGRTFAALVASKPGYLSDTVYFKYSAGDTVNILLRLKKLTNRQ